MSETGATSMNEEDKKKYYLLFDLDGTLTDPKEGICTCVQYALKHFGIDEPDLDKLEPFIGPPLRESFPQFYGLTPEQTEEAVRVYRERFSDVGLFENEVYPGVNQLLRSLRDCGMHLAVASSKPEVYVRRILDKFKLSQYFEEIVGSELDGTRDKKDEVIMEALQRMFRGKPVVFDQVFMIGDTKFDIEGAHKVGIEAVGVSYGYGAIEDLKEAKAEFIVQSVNELRKFLLRGTDDPAWLEGMAATREASDPAAQKASQVIRQNGGRGTSSANGGKDAPERLNRWGKKPIRGRHVIILAYSFFAFLLFRFLMIQFVFPSILVSFEGAFTPGSAMDRALFVRDEAMTIINYNPSFATILTGLAYLIAVIPIKEYAKAIVEKTREEMRLTHLKKEGFSVYLSMGLLMFGMMLCYNLVVLLAPKAMEAKFLAQGASLEEVTDLLQTMFGDLDKINSAQYSCHILIGLVVYGLVTPFAEEILFRGIVHAYVRRFFPIWMAVLFSAILFGTYHGNTIQGFYAMLMGLVLAYAYEYFGSFWAPVIMHMGHNVAAYILTYTLFDSNLFANWITCILSLLLAIGAGFYLVKHKKVLR